MRNLISIASLLLSNCVSGQQLIFRGFEVDTVSIGNSAGYYHINEAGTTTGTEEVLIIIYNPIVKKYLVADYIRTTFKRTRNPDTTEVETKSILNGNKKSVSLQTLDSLLTAFNSNYVRPNYDCIGYERKTFLSLIDEKQVRKVAKKYNEHWQFKNAYSSKNENKTLFDGCHNIDTFNFFLETKFKNKTPTIVTDVWDATSLNIKASHHSFKFSAVYPDAFRQPWYDFSDNSVFKSSSILNLNINKLLLNILPENFYRKNEFELKPLINDYIKWYLIRRDIINARM